MTQAERRVRDPVEAAFAGALHNRDVDGLVALLTEDVRLDAPGFARSWQGKGQVRELLVHLAAIFSESRFVVNETHSESGRVIEDVTIALKTPAAATKDWMVALGFVTMSLAGDRVNHLHVEFDRDALVRQLTEADRRIPAASFRSELALASFDADAAVAPMVHATPSRMEMRETASRSRTPLVVGAVIAALVATTSAALVLRPKPEAAAAPAPKAPASAPAQQARPGQAPAVGKTADVLGPSARPASGGGQTLRLSSTVLFQRNSAQLAPGAQRVIADVGTRLRTAGTGTVEVIGYTDDLGTAASGLSLSRARAEVVAAELRTSVAGTSMTVTSRGAGEANPVAANTSEANRAKNRRVEITYRP